ncbi:periplasmic binding protein-like I [Chytriomyces cf. hyalinus JEL632]|nr:periplasmic binding protein-like I [Chytriomyces cf. hyalinus JEL632]
MYQVEAEDAVFEPDKRLRYKITMNISIGTIGNYCAMKYMTFNGSLASNFTANLDASIVNLNGNSGYAYLADLAVMAAIDDINSDPSILPGIHVSLKRFTDCGSYYPKADADYWGNSGGYASAVTATDIIENHKDVLGVVGNEYSNTARGLAQILSLEQIPYCTAVTGSPRYSDKNKYSYFWRMLSNSSGRYIAFILKYWNIKHIAIIYQADNELGTSSFSQIKSTVAHQNVEVLSTIGLKTMFLGDTMNAAVATLRRVDPRYIIISGTSSFVGSVIYPMGQAGLVGPNHVWIVYNRPKTSADVRNYHFLKGMISVGSTASGSSSHLKNVLNKTTEIAGYAFGNDYFGTYAMPGFYDCSYMMLLGFDKLIKSGATPQDLSNRKLQSQMNISLWRSITNYSGLTMDPVLINELGDQDRPCVFSRYTGDYRNSTTFATSDVHLLTMRDYNASMPIFYNDSSIPPADSAAVELVLLTYSTDSFYARTIISLFGVGLLLSLASYLMLIYARTNKIVRSTSIPECFTLVTGCLLAYAGCFSYINAQSDALCKARVWSLSLAQILIVSPMIAKSLFLVSIFAKGRIYKNDRALKKIQLHIRILNGVAVLIEAILLILWSLERSIYVFQIKDDTSSYWRCASFATKNARTSPVSCVLYAYNGLMILGLLAAVYLEKSVQCDLQDNSATLITVFTSFGLMFLLMFELLGTPDFSTDFKVYVCIWVCITLVLVSTVGSTALDLINESAEIRNRGSMTRIIQQSQIGRNSETNGKKKSSEKASISANQVNLQDSIRRSVLSGANRERKDHPPALYQFCLLANTLEICVWRRRKDLQMWSRWMRGACALHCINSKRVWIAINGPNFVHCTSITDSRLPYRKDAFIHFRNPAKSRKEFKHFEIEFQNTVQAQAFLDEFMFAFKQFKRTE